jgi:hypothetical protein
LATEKFSMNHRNLSSPKLFSATLVVAAFASSGSAKASVTYEFIQQGSDVVMNVSGSVSAARTSNVTSAFDSNPLLLTRLALKTTKTSPNIPSWDLNGGPSSLGSGENINFRSYPGTSTFLIGFLDSFAIENYTLGSPISGSGLLAGQTLASLGFGFTAPGLLASWNITGSSETVEVRIGSTAPSSVPGPLPLFGAAAAFAHSRRLRARLRAGSSSPLT